MKQIQIIFLVPCVFNATPPACEIMLQKPFAAIILQGNVMATACKTPVEMLLRREGGRRNIQIVHSHTEDSLMYLTMTLDLHNPAPMHNGKYANTRGSSQNQGCETDTPALSVVSEWRRVKMSLELSHHLN